MKVYKIILLLSGSYICLSGAIRVRPCRLDDNKCITRNLAANSNCKPVMEYVSPKLLVPTFYFDTPVFGWSNIDDGLVVKNFDKCRVSEFFFNRATKNVVLSIDCPFLGIEGNRTIIDHGTYQEDEYYDYHIITIFRRVSVTINFINGAHMDLCKSAFIYTDPQELQKYLVYPQNKRSANFWAERNMDYLGIYEKESYYFRGFDMAYAYVNTVLCDFGCPLSFSSDAINI